MPKEEKNESTKDYLIVLNLVDHKEFSRSDEGISQGD